jgi:hypothetical protein
MWGRKTFPVPETLPSSVFSYILLRYRNVSSVIQSRFSNIECKILMLLFFGLLRDWVHLVHRPLIGLLYQTRTIDDECGAVDWIRTGKRNGSTRRKPALATLCPPQIPLDQTRDRTRAAALGSQRLVAWAMARPLAKCKGWKGIREKAEENTTAHVGE